MTPKIYRLGLKWPVFTVLWLLLSWTVVAWRLAELPHFLAHSPRSEELEDAVLFTEALTEGLLQPLPDGRLQPLPEDVLLLERAKGNDQENPQATARRERLWQTLYHSAAGTAVLGQVRLWNRSHRLAALRDNSAGDPAMHSTGWRVYDCRGRSLGVGGLVPETFGYIHQGHLQTGFGSWVTGAGSGDIDTTECIEFRNRFSAPEPRPITVQFIGRSLDRQPVDYVCPPLRVQRSPQESCLPSQENCQAGNEKAGNLTLAPQNWTRTLPGSGNALWEREVRLRFAPISHREIVMAGVNIRLTEQCDYVWQTLPAERIAQVVQMAAQDYTVHSRDGLLLVKEDGSSTAKAVSLGLVPLVGFGKGDYDSVSGLLARSRLPSGYDITLTLDGRIQAAARKALQEGLRTLYPSQDERYHWARRAAVVVIAADNGAILGVTGYPEAPDPSTLSAWDLAAFAKVYPLDDPLKVPAWQGVSRLYTPGSTFKTVTALAGLTVAQTGHQPVSAMVQGLAADQFTALTGLALDDRQYRPYAGTPLTDFSNWRIRNFANQPLERMLYRYDGKGRRTGYQPLRAEACVPGSPPVNTTLGLIPALRDSVNIWFSRLAMLMDGQAALNYDLNYWRSPQKRQLPGLYLAGVMEKLGIAKALPLVNAAPSFITAQLAGESGKADLLRGGYPLAWTLAQNAIGQGVQVTPLQMAAIAATIAKGRRIYPYLVQRWGGQPASHPEGETLNLDLTLLRAGMKAVPEVGTAQSAFRDAPDRCELWGKTGTAEIGKSEGSGLEPFKTAWFIGWHAPLAADQPPLAFACMVSHVYGQNDTGGSVCAPIIADLFANLR